MNRMHGKQRGGSVIGLIITLFVIGYIAFVGIQYIPQMIEAQTVQSILDSIEQDHRASPVRSQADIERAWSTLLNINEMNDLKDTMEIDHYGGQYTINVAYERPLDLLYKKKIIQYQKSIILD